MWRLGMLTIVLVSTVVVLYTNRFDISKWALFFPQVQTESVEFGNRILIIAPHPDDETLGGSGVIQKALKRGKSVKVVLFTTGDGYRTAVKKNFGIQIPTAEDFQHLGMIRHMETIAAMKTLGLQEKDIIFLGYPDGGMNTLWEKDWDYTHLHRGLNGRDHSPYSFSYETEAPYCGENVVKNLSDIIVKNQPTDIIYPDPHDHHNDHWATSAFTKYVLEKEKFHANEWTYLVHRHGFPYPWSFQPELPLRPPRSLEGLDTTWHYIKSNKEEVAKKYKAIEAYKSQTKVMGNYLMGFARSNDLLGTYEDPTVSTHEHISLPDPAGDNTSRKNVPKADLLEMGVYTANQQLHVGLKTDAPILPEIEYNFHLRLFEQHKVNRLDVTVKGSKLKFRHNGRNSISNLRTKWTVMDNNQIWISLPTDKFYPLDGFMLSVSTVFKHQQVDRTAWRYVKIKGKT